MGLVAVKPQGQWIHPLKLCITITRTRTSRSRQARYVAKSSLARFAAAAHPIPNPWPFRCMSPASHNRRLADDWNGRCLPSARATARRPLTAEMLINQHWMKWDATKASDFQDRPHVAGKPVGEALCAR
jgi:hypothetical protein